MGMNLSTWLKIKNRIGMLVIILMFSPTFIYSNEVENGYLSMDSTDKIYQLKGKWKFHKGDRSDYSQQHYDDSKWELITVPGQWHMLGIKGIETAWYRLHIFVSPAFKETPISIRVPVIADSHELYINGKLIGGVGKISPKGKVLVKSSQPGVYDIPINYLDYNENNTISLRISDDVGWGGIVTSDFYIGKATVIDRKFQGFVMWNTSIVFILFFLGTYYFILFVFRLQEKAYLYFSLLALIASLLLLGLFSFPYWVMDNFWFNHFIFHSGINIGIMLAIYFAYLFFEYPIDRIVKLISVICVLLFMVLLSTPLSLSILKFYANVTLTIAMVVDLLGFSYLFYLIAKSIKLRKLGARTIGIGGIIAILCIMNDILGYLQLIEIKRVATEGVVVFFVSMSFAMALKFAKVYDETDRLNESLEQSRDQLAKHNKTFEKFVPKQFLARIASEGVENIELGQAESDFITLLFCDIRSFTELSEKMAPQEILDFLNSYLKLMNRPIHAQLGFIDKFIGDAIMAIFDLPDLSDATEAQNAIKAAIGMQEALKEYNEKFHDSKFSPLNIGIGIHSGQAVIGTVGSIDRMDSTVLGDAVNLASRLEGLTKYYGCKVIVSQETLSLLDDKTIFNYRELDHVRVKGKTESVRIYDIFDADTPEIRNLKSKTLKHFQNGLAYREKRDWENATKTFEASLDIYPDDKAALMQLKAVNDLKNLDLPETWDGTVIFR